MVYIVLCTIYLSIGISTAFLFIVGGGKSRLGPWWHWLWPALSYGVAGWVASAVPRYPRPLQADFGRDDSMGLMFTSIWSFRHIWRFSLRYLHRPWDRGINDQVSHRALTEKLVVDETFRACNCCLNKPLNIRMGINGSITSVEASPSATIVDVRILPHNGWLDSLLGCKGSSRLLPHQANWWRFRERAGAGWPSGRMVEDASLQHVE